MGNVNLTLWLDNSISIYKPDGLNFVYIGRSYPPSVVEINITSLINPIVTKVYKIDEYERMFIGLPYLTAN
jgi:hypothetical protein